MYAYTMRFIFTLKLCKQVLAAGLGCHPEMGSAPEHSVVYCQSGVLVELYCIGFRFILKNKFNLVMF